ncbi:hypothetical protein HNR44_002413 [Geomicrobium halophilum]|uniref:Dolichyl-phosphate-mannose-protein mannosyltransferase n=1 Tax=Geomicrobium halophilum TaxID=549000 RepID=A0A841PNT4_9BACL|nr:DUF6020 family protein [Geomicrobium halophilum]MBB6450430.1 hypothetical protein [Geomicrobium halophilum]
MEEHNLIVPVFVVNVSLFTFFIGIWTLLYIVTTTHINFVNEEASTKWLILFYALPVICVGLIYWIGFYPGVMTPDSLNHWMQIETYEFSNWHPFLYTMLMLGLTQMWESPAIISLFQVLAIGFVYGYAMYSLRRMGIPSYALMITTAVFAIVPVMGIYSVTLWKDVLYSLMILLFTIIIMNIVVSRGEWLRPWTSIVFLTIVAILVSFLRNNGFPIAVLTLLMLAAFFWHYWRSFVIPVAVTVATYLIVTGPVFTALDVNSAQFTESLSIPHQQIANIISNDGEMTESEKEYFDAVLPLEEWEESYYPFLSDEIKFHPELNQELILDDVPRYFGNWASLVSNNFSLAVDAYKDQTSLGWQIYESGYTAAYANEIFDNEYGLEMNPPSEFLHNRLRFYLDFTQDNLLEIVWRPALFTFFLALLTFASYLKNGMPSLLVAVPVILNWGTLMAGLPAQDFRYLLANYFTLFVIALFAFVRYKK